MKKIISVILLFVILSFSACGSDKEKKSDTTNTSANSNTVEETIEDVTDNTKNSQTVSVTASYTNSATDKTVTVKTDKSTKTTTKKAGKPAKTTTPIYELTIKYNSISDFKSKVVKYKTFKDILDKVGEKKNYACINPFRQEYLVMIFDDKKAFAPNYPKGYKDDGCYLSSKNYFGFNFSENGSKQTLKIYTANYNNELKTNKYNLSFKNKQGVDIYKNSSGKYCWFLDDKYVVVYSGSSKDFINEVYFSPVYINN